MPDNIFIQKKKYLQNLSVTLFLLLSSFLFSLKATAQCAMCRAVVESEGNTAKAESVNDGIVYLMVFPYLLVGIIGCIIYRTFSKKKA